MAKKRKRSKVAQGTPKASQPWSNEEKATLYGWLDYCVEVLGYGKEDFLSTVCIKLEDQGSSRHDINIIVRKLRRDWQSYGPEEQDHGNEEQKFEEIFERGSLCFTGFSAQEHENIATAKRQFVHESTTTTPAKRLLRDRSSNHLRSVSRTPVQSSHKGTPTLFKRENRSQGSTSLATYDRDQTSWEASIKAPRELKPVIKPDKRPAPQKSRGISMRSDFDSPNSSGLRSSKVAKVQSRTVSVVRDSEEDLADDDLEADNKIEVEYRDESIPKVSRKLSPAFEHHKRCIHDCLFKQHVKGLKPGEIMCSSCGNWQHCTCVGLEVTKMEVRKLGNHQYLCAECDLSSHRACIESGVGTSIESDGIKHKLKNALLEIESLKEKLFHNEREFEEYKVEALRLEDVSRHQRSIQDRIDHIYEGSESSQSIETLLQEREEHIKSLEKRLNDRRGLGKFAKLSQESREAFGVEIGSFEGISKVYNIAKQFALQFKPPRQFALPNLDQYPELKTLLYSGLINSESKEEIVVWLNRLNTQELLRCLITASLFLWVFNTGFPKFTDVENEFFTKYRDCLLQQDGATTVRNLDLAAYHFMIRDKYFHHNYITPEAEKLVIKFSQVLAPLFSPTPNSPTESNWDDFSTWGEEPEKWADRRSWLLDLFQEALGLKSESCLNTGEYEMVIYEPGTLYNEDTMNVETEDGMAILGGEHDGCVVKVCVEGALFSFARPKAEDQTALKPAMPSSNFVQRDIKRRISSQILVKAIVVLVDENALE